MPIGTVTTCTGPDEVEDPGLGLCFVGTMLLFFFAWKLPFVQQQPWVSGGGPSEAAQAEVSLSGSTCLRVAVRACVADRERSFGSSQESPAVFFQPEARGRVPRNRLHGAMQPILEVSGGATKVPPGSRHKNCLFLDMSTWTRPLIASSHRSPVSVG